MQHPTTPPILSALPPLAAMRKEWVEFDWGVLALHLLHQRHEAVGVESGTVEVGPQVKSETIGERHASACRYKNEVPEGSRRSVRRTYFRPRGV